MRANKSKKDRIRLDSLREEGRLKNGGPDIADIWAMTKKKSGESRQKIDYRKKLQEYRKFAEKYLKVGIKKANVLYRLVRKHAKFLQKIPFDKIPFRKLPISKLPLHNKKFQKYGAGVLGLLVIVFIVFGRNDSPQNSATLGATQTTGTSQGSTPREDENAVPREEVAFKPLLPEGKKESDLLVATRKSPSGDVIYSFEDQSDELEIQVTQQKMPEGFKGQEALQIEKIAKDMQAVNVIQIDDNKIYHGVSEKSNVQSLVTTKKGLLIFIRSNTRQPDEFWLNFYLNLK